MIIKGLYLLNNSFDLRENIAQVIPEEMISRFPRRFVVPPFFKSNTGSRTVIILPIIMLTNPSLSSLFIVSPKNVTPPIIINIGDRDERRVPSKAVVRANPKKTRDKVSVWPKRLKTVKRGRSEELKGRLFCSLTKKGKIIKEAIKNLKNRKVKGEVYLRVNLITGPEIPQMAVVSKRADMANRRLGIS